METIVNIDGLNFYYGAVRNEPALKCHPAAEQVGLAPLRPHDLRHSAVSLWIASGANPKVVQTKAGHSSIKVTYDVSGHLFPDYDDRTTRHLENLWDEAKADNVVPIREHRAR